MVCPDPPAYSADGSLKAPLHDILDAEMVKSALDAEGVVFKDCIETPFVTRCLFLSQVLDQYHSCRAAVRRLVEAVIEGQIR
jgi:hypothetical protein